MEIGGRRALLTGASGGIGEAIAHALHSRGASLVLSGRRTAVLEELAGKLGERVEIVPADLSTPDGWETLAAEAGEVDIFVANAALPAAGRMDDFAPGEIDRAIDVNLRAPMQLARNLTPGMLERGSGHLVFLSSTAGKIANAGGSIYSATKFGVRGFADALRDELRGSGVGVTVIFPGFVREAGMFADAGVKLPPFMPTRSPQQVAEAVIRGIERDRGEIDVAPVIVRVSSWLAGIFPGTVAAAARRLDYSGVADQLAEGQRNKR